MSFKAVVSWSRSRVSDYAMGPSLGAEREYMVNHTFVKRGVSRSRMRYQISDFYNRPVGLSLRAE